MKLYCTPLSEFFSARNTASQRWPPQVIALYVSAIRRFYSRRGKTLGWAMSSRSLERERVSEAARAGRTLNMISCNTFSADGFLVVTVQNSKARSGGLDFTWVEE